MVFNREELEERCFQNKQFKEYLENSVPEDAFKHRNCKYYDENSFKEQVRINKPIFSLLHFNIRSLNKHIDELNDFLESLSHEFDFIGLTEIGMGGMPNSWYDI